MHSVDREELKRIQIQILDAVVKFCDENKIHYWIDCGSLLGAVRHKGYIPWDDDIDVGMLREDYDRFMQLFHIQNDRYVFKSIENDSTYLFPFGKVLDTQTLLYEPDRNGIRHHINIDIFPYDNAPDQKLALDIMYIRRNIFKTLRLAQTGILKPNGSVFKRWAIKFVNVMVKPFPENFFTKKIIENSKRYKDRPGSYVGDFTSVSVIKCKKDIFDSYVFVEFEGKKYKAPVGYKKWLRAMYGDYMIPVPREEQRSRHLFEAYAE